ncbi:MAG: VOC family protein [Pseudomonadota bacterium]
MNLGTFSISLAVENLEKSKAFYEALGFEAPGHCDLETGYLIMMGPTATIGLFDKKFIQKNTLTFNPGWDARAQPLDAFTDVRDLQKQIKAAGIEFSQEADESTEGPAHFVVIDPDGNPILVDQHR